MASRDTGIDDPRTADNTPPDVAVLYSWANLQGAKYRDYSASRREQRALARYRAAKGQLERELEAQAAAEAAAAEAEREALAAQAVALSHSDSPAGRFESLRSAEAASRKAAAERVEAARRAEAAARANVLALREERELAEARASAQEQAMIYTESELLRRELAGPQPWLPLGMGEAGEPRPGREFREVEIAGAPILSGAAGQKSLFDAETGPGQGWFGAGDDRDDMEEQSGTGAASPAWLHGAVDPPPRSPAPSPVASHPLLDAVGGDTLQDYRERVAARWFALKGIFELGGSELPAVQQMRPGEVRAPVLAIFSLAGGVGKTSLAATLARALAVKGERVVLTDTTAYGLLPFYFGARELRPGLLRPFAPPADREGEPVSLVVYDAVDRIVDERRKELLAEEILRNGSGNHRVLLDLGPGASWVVERMADLRPTVLALLAPDMNSVIGLQAVERMFRGILDTEGRPQLPFYVLNQFDAALPLHLDVREVFRRKLGDRLLRVAIRRSPAVGEALAEGMTVVDYAPSAPVTQDFLEVAAWLRGVSPPAADGFRSLRRGGR